MSTAAHTFTPTVETYERELVPRIFRPFGERLLDRAALRTAERLLDVACGTGIVARLAAARVGPGGYVAGADGTPAMLEVARRTPADPAPGGGTPTAIEWHEADAAALPFEDASFDVITCQQGLQYVDDPVAVLRDMRRVLAPRGRIAVSVWAGPEEHPGFDEFGEALARHLPEELAKDMSGPFGFGPEERLRDAIAEAGFTECTVVRDLGGVRYPSAAHMIDALGGAYGPMAEAIAALTPRARAALDADLAATLAPVTDDEGVLDLMIARVAIAR